MKKLALGFVLLFSSIGFAADKQKIYNDLQMLYPYFTPPVLTSKVAQTTTPSDFLTSFIPYFYLSLKENAHFLGELSVIKNEFGWCVGDAHFGNFGAVINKFGKSKFTINDLDDAGPCPFVADLLKFLLDAKFKNAAPLLETLKHYAMGVGNKPYDISDVTLKLLSDADKKGPTIDEEFMISPIKLKRTTLSKELIQKQLDDLLVILTKTYAGKVSLLDAYSTTKIGGGSHALTRFVTLVKFENTHGNKLEVLEFKQMVLPGIFPLAMAAIPAVDVRVKQSLNIQQGTDFTPLYSTVKIYGMDMLIRPRWSGNIKHKLKDLPPADLAKITYDMAYTLGKVHGQTASANYLPMLLRTQLAHWDNTLNLLNAYFVDIFKTVKSP